MSAAAGQAGAARACEACGAPLPAAARFCDACGAPSVEEVRTRAARREAGARRERRAVAAMATIYLGTLAALALAWLAPLAGAAGEQGPATPGEGLARDLVFYALASLAALGGLAWLGPGALRRSLAGGAAPRWWLAGLGVAAATFLVGHVYVEGLAALVGFSGGAGREPSPMLVLSIALLPALFEEWIDRGALWTACERVASPAATVLATALLFAFSHGLGGSFLVYPHRFVAGLALGWLRLRSGSLGPGMLAHAGHNLAALAVGG